MELALNLTTLRYLSSEAASGRPARALLIANEYAKASPILVRTLHKRTKSQLSHYPSSIVEAVERGAVFSELNQEEQKELLTLEKPASPKAKSFTFPQGRRGKRSPSRNASRTRRSFSPLSSPSRITA